VREFVLVETRIQTLEYNLELAKNENGLLRNEITRTQAEMEVRIREIENKYDERIAALASNPKNQSDDSGDETEGEQANSEDEKMNQTKQEVQNSFAASNHPKIKVSFLQYCICSD
jgi:hypothetical protein